MSDRKGPTYAHLMRSPSPLQSWIPGLVRDDKYLDPGSGFEINGLKRTGPNLHVANVNGLGCALDGGDLGGGQAHVSASRNGCQQELNLQLVLTFFDQGFDDAHVDIQVAQAACFARHW